MSAIMMPLPVALERAAAALMRAIAGWSAYHGNADDDVGALIANPLNLGRTNAVSRSMDNTPLGKAGGTDGTLRRYVSLPGIESITVPPRDAAIEAMLVLFVIRTITVLAAAALTVNASERTKINENLLAIIALLLLFLKDVEVDWQ